MTQKKIGFLLFFLFFCLFYLAGYKTNAEEEKEIANLPKKNGNGVLVSPILFYLPETRMAFGVAGNYVFRPGDANGDSKPSTISPVLIYTQNRQFKALLCGDIYLKKENYHLAVDLVFQKYPDKFFGIGGYSTDELEENFTPHIFGLSVSLLRKLKEHVDVGLLYDFSKFEMIETEDGKNLSLGDIPGSRGSSLSGVSLLMDVDSRDNIFFPVRGEYCRFTAQFYNKIIGSEYTFQSYRCDLRKYFPILPGHVLALQSIVQTQTGTVPFHRLSRMGGQYVMRGYYDGRYRDRNVVILQAEYRMPLFWRLGAVGFVGAADVAHRFRDFKFNNIKHSYGFGLRYLFNKHEKMYVRFDVGFGGGVHGFYFSVFEAF